MATPEQRRPALPEAGLDKFCELVAMGITSIPLPTKSNSAEELDVSAAKILAILSEALQALGREKIQGRKSAPWWTDECAAAHKGFLRAKRQNPHLEGHSLERRGFLRAVRQAKRAYWRNQIDSIKSDNDLYRIRYGLRLRTIDQEHPAIPRLPQQRGRADWELQPVRTKLQSAARLLPELPRLQLQTKRHVPNSQVPIAQHSKADTATSFREWQRSLPAGHLVVFSDGSKTSSGNVGWGYAIYAKRKKVAQGKGRLGIAEVFDGEAEGARHGLRHALRIRPNGNIHPTYAGALGLVRARTRDQFSAWWVSEITTHERYQTLGLTAASLRCPRELELPHRILHRLLACRTGHGDFDWYHKMYNHDNTRNCTCGGIKTTEHLVYCRKARKFRALWPKFKPEPQTLKEYWQHLMASPKDFAAFLEITSFYEKICPR
ncbi:hypothetical protein ACJZ2D_016377 [Fusarium nematophilum]